MADGGVGIDLYADDIETDYNQGENFGGENADLYDDVLAAPVIKNEDGDQHSQRPASRDHPSEETNGSTYHNGQHHHGSGYHRRHQIYIGNLTWVCTMSVLG